MSGTKRKSMTKPEGSIKKSTPVSAAKVSASVDRSNVSSPISVQSKLSASPAIPSQLSEAEPTTDGSVNENMTRPANYKVKEEFAATAKSIISKHGDILENCLFQGILRSSLLESACGIYEKLKKWKFSVVTLAELESILKDVHDLDRAKVEVSWLLKRLVDIYEAKQCAERSPQIEEQRDRSQQNVEKLEKELSLEETKLLAVKAKLELENALATTLNRTFLDAKEKVFDFCWKLTGNGSCSSDCKFKYPTAEGCKLKEEFQPAAEVIFSKQGDILAEHIFQGSLRLPVLESACSIYMRLEKLNLLSITLADLESLQKDVDDLKRAKVDVSWVAHGLEDLVEAKKLVENPSFMEELRNNHLQKIEELEKERNLIEDRITATREKLNAERAQAEKSRQDSLEVKEKVSRFFRKSLIDGI